MARGLREERQIPNLPGADTVKCWNGKNRSSYRAFGENMAVQQSLIWNMEEGSTQMQQYLDGAMNARQLAAALEKTLQMQKLEGN